MRVLAILLSVCFLFIISVSAQKTAPKFTSVYTDFNKNCRTIEGENGSDPAFNCRGIGGYRIHTWYSASTQEIGAKSSDTKKMIHLVTLGLDFNQEKAKIEWRLVNGKPFAIILRVHKYGEPDDLNPYLGKKIGEELIIRGLNGFEKIDFTVDAKTPNANSQARKLADNAYLNK